MKFKYIGIDSNILFSYHKKILSMKSLLLILILKQFFAENIQASIANGLASTNPELAAVIEIMKIIKTEKSTTISAVHDAKIGFYEFDTSLEFASGTILQHKLHLLLDIWFSDDIFDHMPDAYKKALVNAINEASLQMKNTAYQRHQYSINFHDGKGKINMLVIMFESSELSNGIRWTKQILNGGIVPARDWIVVTHSKSNILGSKRKDEIVYLPPVLSLDHIRNFLEINKQMMFNFHNNLAMNLGSWE